jgi:ERCC4-type nuclease
MTARSVAPVRIVCDRRECRGALYAALRERSDVDLFLARLQFGDFVVEGRFTVERKTAADLLLSLQTGRIFRQVAGMKRHTTRPLLLVERGGLQVGATVAPSVRGLLASLSAMWYLPVLWTADAAESAELLVTLGRLWVRDRRETWAPPPRTMRRPADPRVPLLLNIPGLGPAIARRLLARFGTIRALAAASPGELAVVDGVGSKRARAILRLLAAPSPAADQARPGVRPHDRSEQPTPS